MVRRKISNPREIVSEVNLNDLNLKLSPCDSFSKSKSSAEYNIRNKMMSTNGQHYCLRWNNYQTNMTSVFHQLLQNEAFVDVTLACNDLSLKAHKVVLSACSSYFQKLLLENPCPHPTIIMPADVCFADLKFIIEFVYRGEIDVSQAELQSLLKTADQLKIKGLCEVSDNSTICNNNTDNYPFGFHHGAAEILPSATRRLFTNKYKRPSLQSNLPTSSKKYKLIPNTSKYRIYSNNREQSINNDEELNNETIDKTAKSINTSEENEDDDVDKNATMPVVILQEDQQSGSTEDTKGCVFGGRDATGTFNGQRCDRDGVISPALSDNSVQQPLNMTGHGLIPSQHVVVGDVGEVELPPEPPAPAATPVRPSDILQCEPSHCTTHHDLSETSSSHGDVKVKFETLRSVDANDIDSRLSGAGDNRAGSSMGGGSIDGDDLSQHSHLGSSTSQQMHHTMMITPELLGLIPSSSHTDLNSEQGLKTNGHSMHGHISNGGGHGSHTGTGGGGPKTWSQEDMELALDALRNHNMSLTKASATYGIPSTTLWQRAHRLGIDTPKKEGPTKSWTEDSLNSALEALRTGTISANKASKAYGIPSSTLYKIARREGIRLAAPFNAAPTTWSPEDLERALESIRSGQTSVQRASTEFGIPTGTLYGRCKREGIELSRSNPTPWSEDAMGEALEAVRVGQMSINQAAIHYNLPYSSLYGRFKRGKYETEPVQQHQQSSNDANSQQQLQISMGGDSSSQDHNMMVAYHHQSPPNNGPQQAEQQYHQYHDIS